MSEEELRLSLVQLNSLRLDIINSEVQYLLAVNTWAVASLELGYEAGDRVKIVSPEPSAEASRKASHGWHHYREALQVGQVGIAGPIRYNTSTEEWQCLVGLDRAWSVYGYEDTAQRFWRGPQEDCPPGFEWREQKTKHFHLNVHHLRKTYPTKGEP